jgi:hypothetical protein
LIKHFPKITQLIVSGELDEIYSNIAGGVMSYNTAIAPVF